MENASELFLYFPRIFLMPHIAHPATAVPGCFRAQSMHSAPTTISRPQEAQRLIPNFSSS